MFFDFYVTLWVIISPNKHILVKIRLEKVDLGEVYIQKEQENFKKRSSSNIIGGPLHMSHPVYRILNKVAKPFNETFAGFKCMLLGLRIYFKRNPR